MSTITKETELKTFQVNTKEKVKKTKKKHIEDQPFRSEECKARETPKKSKRNFREMLPSINMQEYDHYFDYEINVKLGELKLIEPKEESDILSIPLDEFLTGKKQLFLDTFPIGEIHEDVIK
jgi:hypothetical protein